LGVVPLVNHSSSSPNNNKMRLEAETRSGSPSNNRPLLAVEHQFLVIMHPNPRLPLSVEVLFTFQVEIFLDAKVVMIGGGTTNIFGGSTPSAFGGTQQQQSQQPSQNLGVFGNTQTANNASPFGAFGMTDFETPFFFLISDSVGTSNLKPSVFGTQSNTAQTAFGTFGNPQPQQNQPNQQPSLFGNNTLFGNQQPQNHQQGAQPNQCMCFLYSERVR
jgi:hypothetical protein